jgi:hypothetical protein
MQKNRKRYYVQLMIQQEQLSKDILKEYYKTKCVVGIYELIKEETKKYTSQIDS